MPRLTQTQVAQVENEMVTTVDFDFAATGCLLEGIVTINGNPAVDGKIEGTITTNDGEVECSGLISDDGSYAAEGLPPGKAKLNLQIHYLNEDDDESVLQESIEIDVIDAPSMIYDTNFSGDYSSSR